MVGVYLDQSQLRLALAGKIDGRWTESWTDTNQFNLDSIISAHNWVWVYWVCRYYKMPVFASDGYSLKTI